MAGDTGPRVRLAARYRPPRPLEARLALGRGSCDAVGRIVPSGDWLAATPDDLAAVIGAPDEIDRVHMWLFGLPHHLLRRWWELADRADSVDGLPGFDRYARELAEYFTYKRWPLPDDSLIEAAAVDPAWQASGELRPGARWLFAAGTARLVACINLDESACAMVVSVGPPADGPPGGNSRPASDIALLEVRLDAGEGLFVPSRVSCAIRPAAEQEMGIYLMIGSRRN